jgi:ribose/xylose/arabinose/galactoside ABC-type transport system permease subunit
MEKMNNGKNFNSNLAELIKNRELFITFILLIIFFSVLSDSFLTTSNITNILLTTSIGGVLALGLAFVMMSGDFDLSFASAVGLLNLVGIILIDKGLILWIVFPIVILAGILWAYFNSLLIIKLGIHAFIATIATATIGKGFIYWISKGATYYGNYPKSLSIIGRGTIGIFPISSIIFISISVISILLANHSKFGRYIYAVGNNSEAAEYVGIDSKKVRTISYLVEGCLIGIAAIILSSKLCSAPSAAGEGFLMTVIASAFLGATAFKPGVVNVGGSILAIFFLTIIENGLIMLNVPFYFKYVVQGLVIIGAVAFISLRGGKNEGPPLI